MEQVSLHTRPLALEGWPELELTMPQFRALLLLGQGPRRMGDLASHLGVSLPSATSVVERLVQKGLVERRDDPSDRRVVLCALTPRGREEVEKVWRAGQMRLEAVADALSTEELALVVRAMELVLEALRRRGDRPEGGAGG